MEVGTGCRIHLATVPQPAKKQPEIGEPAGGCPAEDHFAIVFSGRAEISRYLLRSL
jgi:hypothetical protein